VTHGSLFSGIGGFDLAAEWMGWTNVFHCEFAEFPRKILNHYWPEAISYHDIKTTDFTRHFGAVDIITGGFPCQPYSAAGKRKGKDDDRHLWPEMLRAIREVRPRWVVGENVFGLTTWDGGVVLEEVCADLQAEGYAVQPFIIPAAAVGAPHRRDRVWIVANAQGYNADRTNDCRRDGETSEESQRSGVQHKFSCDYSIRFAANADNTGDSTLRGRTDGSWTQSSEQREQSFSEPSRPCDTGIVANADSIGLSRPRESAELEWWRSRINYAQNNSSAWDDFPTVAPICSGDDGLPRQLDGITFPKWRNESIKAYGNAIVPQVALQIFQAIQTMEDKA
jgi:DNA (cytosine-5)-methyltransferase 1